MIKTLAAASSMLVLIASGVCAATNEELASDIIGKKAYTSSTDNAVKVGEIEDMVIDTNGNVSALVVSVGGFLGIGEKKVAVPFNSLKWAEKNGDRWLVINATKEELKAQPAFDRKAYQVGGTAAKTTTATTDRSTLTPVDLGTIRSEELVGTTVYGANDAQVGKIGDVILTTDKKVDAVIIDVGGFLGMGTKEVAVGMDKLSFMADKDGRKYLYTPFTKDQLSSQPPYDKATWATMRDKQRMTLQ